MPFFQNVPSTPWTSCQTTGETFLIDSRHQSILPSNEADPGRIRTAILHFTPAALRMIKVHAE